METSFHRKLILNYYTKISTKEWDWLWVSYLLTFGSFLLLLLVNWQVRWYRTLRPRSRAWLRWVRPDFLLWAPSSDTTAKHIASKLSVKITDAKPIKVQKLLCWLTASHLPSVVEPGCDLPYESVMFLKDKRNRTTSPFSFLIGTMSSRHQNVVPGHRGQTMKALVYNQHSL